MAKYNAHKLFFNDSEQCYLKNLDVIKSKLEKLKTSRDEVRRTISNAIINWKNHISENVFFEEFSHLNISNKLKRPTFRMQGSMSYNTLNTPAYSPPQQIDIDDGMFLPISYFEANGGSPHVASRGLFKLVELTLQPLCDKNNWKLDTSKDSCVRIQINADSHLDIALYAIPDTEFTTLSQQQMEKSKYFLLNEETDQSFLELSESIYNSLSSDQIMLAHRIEGWKPSDPRKLDGWFKDAVSRHSNQVRRVCRYFKAWRDEQWESCGLSSIAIMKCIVDSYDKIASKFIETRDDDAIHHIASLLPEMLQKRIQNPVINGQYLDEGWTDEDRHEYVKKTKELYTYMQQALTQSNNSNDTLSKITYVFGNRIPSDTNLIDMIEVTSGSINNLGNNELVKKVKKDGGGRYA